MPRIYFIILVFSLIFPKISLACQVDSDSDDTFNKRDWLRIQKITKNNSMAITRKPVNKKTIIKIIGFGGKCSTSAGGRIEQCIWIDRQDCKKKIKAKFRDAELSTISKSGF